MLNSRLKKEALRKLKRESMNYAQQGGIVQENAMKLLDIRRQSSETIKAAEVYVNKLANTPKEYASTFSEINLCIIRALFVKNYILEDT